VSNPPGNLLRKDPDASAWPQGVDWTDYLANIDPGEILSSSSWAVSGPDALLTTASASIVAGSRKTQVRLSGGTLGAQYTLTNSIVTSGGTHDDQSIPILIENK
jgi:hypothetical protein